MGELTGKQKRVLRALGRKLAPVCVVGKAGLTEEVLENALRILAHCELIKVRLPPGPTKQRRETAEQLAREAGADLAGVLGRTALLFRPNRQVDPRDHIVLP